MVPRYFYPRPPRGGRPLADYFGIPTGVISIHALREEGDGSIYGPWRWGDDFYPRPPRGGRRDLCTGQRTGRNFYPRPPRGGRHKLPKLSSDWIKISIHALREEGDNTAAFSMTTMSHFYPRPPRGGRPSVVAALDTLEKFLSTPSARRATDFHESQIFVIEISIHALREEGDGSTAATGITRRYFYPRPPRGGRL